MQVETVTVVISDEDGNEAPATMGAYTVGATELIRSVTDYMKDYVARGGEALSVSDFTLYLVAKCHLEHEEKGGELPE